MKLISYIIGNTIFTTLIYYGFFEGVEGARNVVLFLAWFMGVLSLVFTAAPVIEAMKYKTPPVPRWLDLIYDICVIGVFAWFGYFFTAIIYTIHLFMLQSMWDKVEKLKSVDVNST